MRLIDADAFKEYIRKGVEENADIIPKRLADAVLDIMDGIMLDIDEQPTIEAEPVRRGHWLYTEAWPHRVYCSVCYRTYALKHWQVWEDGSLARAYCPNCGAEMEGDE